MALCHDIIDDVTDVLDEVLTNLYMYDIRSLRARSIGVCRADSEVLRRNERNAGGFP